MNKLMTYPLVACGALLLGLAACQKQAESPSEVASDIAAAQADRAEAVADASGDQARVQQETAGAAVSPDPDNRGGAIEDRAEARYQTAIAAAKGDLDIAKQGCDALQADAQAQCRASADAAYEAARSQAMVTLEADRRRGEATQKLDN